MIKNRFHNPIIVVLGTLGTMLFGSAATAATPVATLKQVNATGGKIELQFDGKVAKPQVKTEFFNDVVQLSLTDVSVYPAKIAVLPEPQRSAGLLKVFAYQYAPRLVRCRITVRGKAENFKDRLKVVTDGKLITLKLEGAGGKDNAGVAAQVSSGMRIAPGTSGDRSPLAQAPVANAGKAVAATEATVDPKAVLNEVKLNDADEKALLERVVSQPAPKPAAKAAKSAKDVKDEDKNSDSLPVSSAAPARGPEARGASPLPSVWSVLFKLLAVIGLFGGIAYAVKKFGITGKNRPAWLGSLGKKNEAWVEVLSTHHLGPKKSISVVKVMGRVLVLGVTEESINLISQLSGDEDFDLDLSDLGLGPAKAAPAKLATDAGPRLGPSAPAVAPSAASAILNGTGATAAGPAVFAHMLGAETAKPATATYAASASSSASSAIRDRIRSRLEGLKQL